MDNNITPETNIAPPTRKNNVRFAAGAILLIPLALILGRSVTEVYISVFGIMLAAAHLFLAAVALFKKRGSVLNAALIILLFTSTLNASDVSAVNIVISFTNIGIWGGLLLYTLSENKTSGGAKYGIISSLIFHLSFLAGSAVRIIVTVRYALSTSTVPTDDTVYTVLFVLSTLLIGKWILDPFERTHESVGEHNPAWVCAEKRISIAKHALLLFFTFGIWHWIWIYQTTKYTNSVRDKVLRSPRSQLLLYMFIPFYSIYWTHNTLKRLFKLKSGIPSDFKTVCMLSSFFVPILPPILIQDAINQKPSADVLANLKDIDGETADSDTEIPSLIVIDQAPVLVNPYIIVKPLETPAPEELPVVDEPTADSEETATVDETTTDSEEATVDEPTADSEETVTVDEPTADSEETTVDESTADSEEATVDEPTADSEETVTVDEPTADSEETVTVDETTADSEEAVTVDETTADSEEAVTVDETTADSEKAVTVDETTADSEKKADNEQLQ